jgi:hypothetical protein
MVRLPKWFQGAGGQKSHVGPNDCEAHGFKNGIYPRRPLQWAPREPTHSSAHKAKHDAINRRGNKQNGGPGRVVNDRALQDEGECRFEYARKEANQ